jgi:hypothetical protein
VRRRDPSQVGGAKHAVEPGYEKHNQRGHRVVYGRRPPMARRSESWFPRQGW